MRKTKVYSITMPPEMARWAERLAKKESRTMSELMREALRRYQNPPVFLDPMQYIRQVAPTPPEFRAVQKDAERKGTNRLTEAEINREVAAVRRQQSKRKSDRAAK